MKKLVEHLKKRGEVAIIPTDTVYGVVARASDQAAVTRLYKLKHRESKPGTLVAANIDQLINLGIDSLFLKKAEKLWPGAISVIIPCDQNMNYLHQGVGSLAIRIPDNQWLLKLLRQTGPLLTSSANQPGEPPATTAAKAKAYFSDQIDWYEDGGYINREPSTIIEITEDTIQIIRQGAVKIDQ